MNKHCLLYLSFFFAMLITAIASASEDTLPVKQIPHQGHALRDFVPRGWMVEQEVSGDLNGDGAPDRAAILVENKPDMDKDGAINERQRGLIILLSAAGNSLQLAGTNDSILQCTTCGGVKGGVSMEIKKGVVIISQMSGSREFTYVTWRFRLDANTARFLLIGKDEESGDSILGTGTIESINYLTGRKIVEKYRYDKTGERKIMLATKRETITKSSLFLEECE